MPTKALRSSAPARIVRPERGETCPVAKLMREAAACWRLIHTDWVELRIDKLPSRDRSELTAKCVHRRLHRRLKGIETLASELQPTSVVGVAYQLLLTMNLTTLDDEIAACDKERFGPTHRLRDKVDTAQNTIISAYHGLRKLIHDPDLEIVERPHSLKKWKPNHTVSALLSDLMPVRAEAV